MNTNIKASDRRVFLRQATAVAISLACNQGIPSWGQIATTSPKVNAWVTKGEERYNGLEVEPWRASTSVKAPDVEIDPTRRFQSILGFGGAFTDSSCFLLSQMETTQRRKLMEELLGSAGLGLSTGRTCIGASDYSRTAYTFDDSPAPDPELRNFSIAHDIEYILPMLREAVHVNPELFLFSSPWSPPAWMKAGESLLGGSMRKHYFASYAQYFVKFIEAYKAEGVTIGAVTPQNEVDTDQDGQMPAALWGQEYETAFIGEFLGPAFRNASIDTKIWILDHNYNLCGRATDELSDPGVFKYAEGVAWHGYVGTPDAMSEVHDAFPTKSAYWTEGGPDITAPDYASDWSKWSSTFTGILKNRARCIVAWNLVLDETGAPNIGPFKCGGLVTLDSKTQKITRSGQYWAFAHFSKAVHRGAQVLTTTGTVSGIDHVAFANPDGSYVLVLTNRGAERDLNCRFREKSLHLKLAQNSIVTLTWS
jgi:glucosylceramidase